MHHNRRQRARAALSSPVSPGSTARSNHASVARSDGVTSEDFWRPREQDSYFLDAASSSSNVSRHNTDGSEQSQGAEATGSTPEAESLCSTPGSSGSAPDDRNWKVAPDDGPHGETWNGYGMERQSKHAEPPGSDTSAQEFGSSCRAGTAPVTPQDDCISNGTAETAPSTEQSPGFWGTLFDSLARAVDAMSVLSPETLPQDVGRSVSPLGHLPGAADEEGGLAGSLTRAIDDMTVASPGGFLLGEVDKDRCVSPLVLDVGMGADDGKSDHVARKIEDGSITWAACERIFSKIDTPVYDISQAFATEPGPPVPVSVDQDEQNFAHGRSTPDDLDYERRDSLSLQGDYTDEEGDEDADDSPAPLDICEIGALAELARVCIESDRENVGPVLAKAPTARHTESNYWIMPARLPMEPDPHNFLVLPTLLDFMQPLQLPNCHHEMRADPFPPFPPREEMPPEDFQLSFKPTRPSVRGADQDLMAHLEESYHATGLMIGLRPDRGPPLSQRLRKVLWHLDDNRKNKMIISAKKMGLWSLYDQLRAFDAADEVYREEFQRQLRRRTWHGRDRDATPRPSRRRVSAGEYLVEARSELEAQLLLRAQQRQRHGSNPYYRGRGRAYSGGESTRVRESVEAWSEDVSDSPDHSAFEPLLDQPVSEPSQNGTDRRAFDPNGDIIRRMDGLIREAINVVPGRSVSGTPPSDPSPSDSGQSTSAIAADTGVQHGIETQQVIATVPSVFEPFDFMFETDTPAEQSMAQDEDLGVPDMPQAEPQQHDEMFEADAHAEPAPATYQAVSAPDMLEQDFQLFGEAFDMKAHMEEALPPCQMQSEHDVPHAEEELHDEMFGPDVPGPPIEATHQTASTSLTPQQVSQPHDDLFETDVHAEAASVAPLVASAHDVPQAAGTPSDAVSVMTSSSTSSQRSRHKRSGALDFTLNPSDSSWRLGRTHSRASAVLNWTNQEASASSEREEPPKERQQFVGPPHIAPPPKPKSRRFKESMKDFTRDVTSPSPADGRGRRRSSTADDDPGPSPTDRRGRRRSSMIESLPSSTLKPPADENLNPDPRLTLFDADQTSPTEDDLERIRHAAALAKHRGQMNAEEVRESSGSGV
ncbi:hypothetical protein LTR91_012717 [Friedmanniomyces endolithicus]|uniref:Uncharacterized protein n=1 Tax=Friedmanniomyces endolithicus TaxID=329885 RepID=A0AAN6KF71_9PEZI|nr:hypothetical protein LTR75_009551 [Friedmanniomyces endolithicus]KAK0855604.1 hypothetical protein LTR03_001704 [Friedmanniomyces endolithicus]KAK0904387.1 hypothetical protein LTR57_018774 [Friedmanniomyces endolithicus]KAK0979119.1 hypothetical protein LTR91_012717 [Friedmanniomyces endolithicus]KAK1051069.1 hypothetical protein LTS16_002532 [Friedmanniomyces endolithicus]